MEQRVVQIVVVGSIMAACLSPREVHSEAGSFVLAEPSQHVMHIRKLSDSDNLKIELEPVWFHLESAEQQAGSESQQMKRQTRPNTRRPVQVFSSLKQLERHQRRNRHGSESLTNGSEGEAPESIFKDFWHVDIPRDSDAIHELAKKSSSLEQHLKDIDLPTCFRRYMHEMYDRNNESVRKLMRCLAQHSAESCDEARLVQRAPPHHVSDQENFSSDDPHRRLHERKVIRKRKFSDHREEPPTETVEQEGLKFEKQFIRSDSDDGGQVFAPTAGGSTESGSNESSSSSDAADRGNDVHTQTQGSHEPDRKEQKYDYREPYRRLPQKYNTQKRYKSSGESEQDGSCEDSDESCEEC